MINPYGIQRGALCVLRMDSSTGHRLPTVFQIAPRANWKEWSGVFTYLGDQDES